MKTYLVGGAVRDTLLGLKPSEKDWVVTGATIDEMIAKGFLPVGKQFPVFLHPVTHEEYALARQERKSAPGHKGFEVIANPAITIEQDLLRRDLTINAIAQDENGRIIDPYNGCADLETRKLRHVSEAFAEDPLRVLRVARFKSTLKPFGFEITPETLQLMQDISTSGELATLPKERIWRELEKALQGPGPCEFIETLWRCKALQHLVPELDRGLSLGADQVLPLIEYCSEHEYSKRALLCVFVNACMLFHRANQAQLESTLEALGLPKTYSRKCVLIFKYLPAFATLDKFNSRQILDLLSGMNALRNAQEFDEALTIIRLLIESLRPNWRPPDTERLIATVNQITRIDHEAIQGATRSKDEFLYRLKKERLMIIEKMQVEGLTVSRKEEQ